MRFPWPGLALPGFLGTVLVATLGGAPFYPQDPPAAHTGGFGEPTCHRCHFDQPMNAPGGSLRLVGVPELYRAGARYTLTVELARPAMQRGGFQVSARFADGARGGRQAGRLGRLDDRVEVVRDDSSAVQYAHHTETGTTLATPDTMRWRVAWTAPETALARVVFHLSANAANDDASEFGDFVYVVEGMSRGPGERE